MNDSNYNFNKDRLNSFRNILPHLLKIIKDAKNKKILDLGCGNGHLIKILKERGYDVYGIDNSNKKLDLARNKCPGRIFKCDLESLKLPKEVKEKRFDIILSTEVIEHLYDPSKLIEVSKKVLKEDGEFIITTPYHGYLKNISIALFDQFNKHFNPLHTGGHIKILVKKYPDKIAR